MSETTGDVPIKALGRTFGIIKHLRESDGMGVSELARALDLPTSTVHDHLRTLRELGYATTVDGKYHVATRFLYLGDQLRRQMPIFRATVPELDTLAEETGEHASLTVEEQGLGVILYDVRGEQAIRFNAYPGMRTKLHLSAAGKAILASLEEARVDEIVERHGLPAVTPNSISEEERLKTALDRTRRRGFAIDREESLKGMCGVGVALRDDRENVLGGISLYGPRSRMGERRLEEAFPDTLREAANVMEIRHTFENEDSMRSDPR